MGALNDIFAASGGNLIKANAGVDVATAKQAVTDGQAAASNALSAIQAKTGPRPTGGGQFGPLNQQRGNLVLGPLGGLATANRTAEATVEKGANLVNEQQDRTVGIQHDNPGFTAANATASQTPGGYAKPSGINVNGFRTQVTKYDDSGTQSITYR